MRLLLSVVLSCAFLGAAFAEDAPKPAKDGVYSPDLAELMAGTQLRHFKLAFAGRMQNWELAEFEVLQMRRNFAAAAKYFPEVQGVPVAKLLREYSEPALDDISKSIKEKDFPALRKSFGRLTEACNACHKAAGMGFIRIRIPTASPFSNQDYKPDR
jgi:hypothetical protein